MTPDIKKSHLIKNDSSYTNELSIAFIVAPLDHALDTLISAITVAFIVAIFHDAASTFACRE